MKLASFGMGAAFAAAILVAGCKKADDEFAPAFVPKTYTFQGKLDPVYSGTWVASDGSSTLDIQKDGTLKIDSVTRSVAGKSVSHITGKWLVDSTSLMFQYTVGSQPQTVLKYGATVSGSSLTLVQEGAKRKMVYKKKS